MKLDKELELIHLQLTRNCNLRCWFCGQWGQEGFFSQAAGTPLTKEEWFAFMDELAEDYPDGKKKPSVILWGGEPLCCDFFDEAAMRLFRQGFDLGLITNATMLKNHSRICNTCFRKIYISIDGPKEVHDAIRGKGTFEKVREGREHLSSCKVILMTVLTEQTDEKIQELVDALSILRPDELILQQRIGLTAEEIDCYKKWMKKEFGMEAPYIDSWKWEDAVNLKEQQMRVYEQLENVHTDYPVTFLPHRNGQYEKHCLSPCRHMHIAWNGDVLYCTDFYDFTAGNIRDKSWKDIFRNEKSQRFCKEVRKGRCVTCNHCSWRNSESFGL